MDFWILELDIGNENGRKNSMITVKLYVNRLKDFWRKYKRNKMAVTGLIILFLFIGIAALAEVIAPFKPFEIGMSSFMPPGMSQHPLGTDDLGKDIYSGVLYGMRTSFFIGVLAASSCVSIGMLVGVIAGYFGGIIDTILMRITDLFMTIPKVFLAILLVAFIGPTVWVVAIISWPTAARLMRAEFLSLKERDFVMAAKAMGFKDRRIILYEILPNAMTPIIVDGTIEIGYAITLEAGLSFLGLGDPMVPSLGYMLFKAQLFLRSAWWMSVFPGLAIIMVVWAFNLVGDGLNEALNPRLRET
jgi:peptide/nickel transport system permease protein